MPEGNTVNAFGVVHKSYYSSKYKNNPVERRNNGLWTVGGAAAGTVVLPVAGTIAGGVLGHHFANEYNEYADRRDRGKKRAKQLKKLKKK